MKKQQVSEYVGVVPRYLRSVNLSNDWRRDESFEGYILTPNVSQALERLCNGLTNKNGQCAFTLIGPYGTGKSAFSVYLCQLLSKDDKISAKAKELLADKHLDLYNQIELLRTNNQRCKGFLPIPITARRRPIAQLILEGLLQSISELKRTASVQKLTERLQIAIDANYWKDTATILKFLEQIGNEAKSQGYAGQILLIDEAGKSLEYALQDKEGGDIYVFQEIAEYANRSKEIPLLFVLTLHQMFDSYVELAERTIRAEWTKIQERFEAIQFAESAATCIQMLADALQTLQPLPVSISQKVDIAIEQLIKSHVSLPIGIDIATFKNAAKRAYPLHPTVLIALPYLFRRLAQNERSIFSYLTSHEPFGLQEHLQNGFEKDSGFVRLYDIYTYLMSNFEAELSRLPHAKRLLEANDVIDSRRNLSPLQYNIVRMVAILNVLGQICPIRATLNFLECASPTDIQIETELNELKQQSIVTYRKLDCSYRVWEGSDVDIDARMKDARRHLEIEGGAFLETLRRHLSYRTIVARRHSLETGTYRFFKVEYAEHIDKIENYSKMQFTDGESGCVLIIFPSGDIAALSSRAEKATKGQNRLIIALPGQISVLRSIVEEIACLRWVQENTEELRDDRVARRELSLRLVEAEQRVAKLIQTLLDPRQEPVGNSCSWFWNGKNQTPQSPVDITRLLSNACDNIYPKSPRVRNELIARNVISSAASGARKCLLAKILTCSEQEKLGIVAFPPERSIYESLFNASGMHAYNEAKGCWEFQMPPVENSVNLKPCWNFLEQRIFADSMKRIELKDVFAELAQPPYGLPDGIHPILFTAFYFLNQDELFLYRDGSFIADPQLAHFELLQKRMDLFSISGARLDGIRRSVVDRLAAGLNTTAKTASVVRSLFKSINALPQITLKSSRFKDKTVIEMREYFLKARSPEELLFLELPECFGIKPFLLNEKRENDIELFFENLNRCLTALINHTGKLQDDVMNVLLNKCNLEQGNRGWIELEKRASWLGPRVNHEIVTPFINSIKNGMQDNHNPRPALSCISKRPFELWTDIDVERFSGLAEGVADLFRQTWRNFGYSTRELSNVEIQEKSELRKILDPHLKKMQKKSSTNVISALLVELLNELEGKVAQPQNMNG